MYYIAGSNLFGQWFGTDLYFNAFKTLENSFGYINELDMNLDQMKLQQINWSYNILEIDKTYYVSGAWDGKEKQFVKVPLPSNLNNINSIKVAGNDNNILLVCNGTIWVKDLDFKSEFKEVNFNVEQPISISKKQKIEQCISKVVIVNNSCLYLNIEGNVYGGILPSYVDTSHCLGKVCDIQCGYEHFLILTDAGRVYSWGNGRRLQLGHGDISNVEIPTEIEALAGIKIIKIRAGGWHALALSEFGDMYAWGWNETGQLGIKEANSNKESLKSYSIPTLVDLFSNDGTEINRNIKDIACGSKHSAVLLDDNSMWTAGNNKYGQLGVSEQKYPSINSFKKVFEVSGECLLMCGPWTTVLMAK